MREEDRADGRERNARISVSCFMANGQLRPTAQKRDWWWLLPGHRRRDALATARPADRPPHA